MSVGLLSSQQLRSLIEDKWQRDKDALALGLHVASSVQGPKEVDFEFGKASVVRADTVFEVRQALVAAEKAQSRTIVLTALQQGDLGHDVVGRMARSRLFAVDHWAGLCSLFKAKELDRSICDPAIAQALMEFAPPDGYPPVSAGLLDSGTVWRAICRHVFDMGEREPDLVTLLLWASSDKGESRYRQAGEDIRLNLRRRLVFNLGEAAASVLNFVDSDAAKDVLAMAVVCQVVFGLEGDSYLDAAAARMEQFHSNKPINRHIGQALGKVAIEAIADLDRREDPRIAQQHLQRADELLRQFVCEEYAYHNVLSRRSFDQRLERLGQSIKKAVKSDSAAHVSEAEQRLEDVLDHRVAKLGRNRDQVNKAEMAVRLLRWLRGPSADPGSFADFCQYYVRETSYVDWAREPLCRGEDVAELSSAYQGLDQAVLRRREEGNREFARLLSDWLAVGSQSEGVLGVEDLLGKVMSQVIGAGNRVLLIVLDGMSWAVCHELLEGIRQDHWYEATLDEASIAPPPMVATVPSVTTFSRTSLLSGALTKGDQALERRNFQNNKALEEVCDRRYPPSLFHKQQLTEGNRGVISEEVSQKILSPHDKAVGVVINAIDDRLSNAQQVLDSWTIGRISPLRALLRLARDSGRVVILASDHGHVWHRPDGQCRTSEESTRWRASDQGHGDDEIVLAGRRVIADADSVVVPWSEKVYYRSQQNGYHGGATPQEMVCPLVLLTDKTSAYSGLFRCEYPKPDWWTVAPAPTPTAEKPRVKLPALPKVGPLTLFDLDDEGREVVAPAATVRESSQQSWIELLLASPAYRDQRALVRRHAVADEVMRSCLSALDGSGGIMTPIAFAKAAQIPVARLDGLLSQIGRILNVDGYEIISLDRTENRVELNVPRLKRQFDID